MSSRKNRLFAFALCIPAMLLLAGCAAAPVSVTVFAMDTVCELTAYGTGADEAIAECSAELSRLERELSATGSGDVARINAGAGGTVAVSDETRGLVDTAKDVAALTSGAFDITVYPIVRAWGFPDAAYRVPEESELTQLITLVGSERIATGGDSVTIEPGMAIDLGGIAKGYAGQKLTELMREHGVTSGIVTLGGNVQTLGVKPDGSEWTIGLRDPLGGVYAILSAADKAVVTSGGYIRYFEKDGVRYHHIIDPHTGYPSASGVVSVTVVADSGTAADALSTAFFVMGEAEAQAFYAGDAGARCRAEYGGFEAVFLSADGRVTATPGIAHSVTLYGDGGGYKFGQD